MRSEKFFYSFMENDLFLPHLNVQTNSNISLSFISISQLIDLSKEKKLEYLAIADYYPFEVLDFINECKNAKIKAIWGTKIFGQEVQSQKEEENIDKKKYSLTIYPQNSKGYREVLQKLFSGDSPSNRIFSIEDIIISLSKNCSIVLEAHKIEEIRYLASKWILSNTSPAINKSNIFIGFDFFLFSPTNNIPKNIIPVLIPFFSVKTLTDEDTTMLEIYTKTNLSRHFLDKNYRNLLPYLKNTNEFLSVCTDDVFFYQLLLVQWQSFLSKIDLKFANKIESKIIENKKKQQLLLKIKSQCLQKLLSLPINKEKIQNYYELLDKELKTIEKLNYLEYFATFIDIIKHLQKQRTAIGPGRGSVVSSLVSYLLDITQIDPLEHNLFFERFLNEKRQLPADIDLDIYDRDEVYKYLFDNYAKNKVARIITKKKIGWKLALTETAKIYQISERDLKKINSLTWKNNDLSETQLKIWEKRYPLFCNFAKKIWKLYYDVSLHPSGIIISDISLLGLVPLSIRDGYLLSLWEEDKLNKLRLKKYDFLSLKDALGFIRDVQELLPNIQLPNYNQVDLRNQKTWTLLNNLLLTDIFQLDTVLARNLFSRFKPTNFKELTFFLALNRPGIKKKIEEIIRDKFTSINKLSSVITNKEIKDIVAETNGFIIFEEQISQILSLIYNCSFAEAEEKRKEIKHQTPSKEEFIKAASSKLVIEEIEIIYQHIISEHGYTFNKGHAIAYSYLTYYCAYLKANYFDELITYFLNNKKEKKLSYLKEAFFNNFEILNPDINFSQNEWVKKEKTLIMGFKELNDYKTTFFNNILEERNKNGPYHNWVNFINRTLEFWEEIELINLENWIKSSLFRSLKISTNKLLLNSKNIFCYLQLKKKLNTEDQNLPFVYFSVEDREEKKLKEKKIKQLINSWEKESIDCFLSYFTRWKKIAALQPVEKPLTSLLDVLINYKQQQINQPIIVNIYAVIEKIEKNDNDYYAISLQDIRSSFKLKITDQQYQKYSHYLEINNELLFSLEIQVKYGQLSILSCNEITSP